MPQNERSLKRHERSCVPRNEARCVVSNRATRRNRSTISEGACRSGKVLVTIHSLRDWILASLRLRVELDAHCIWVDIVKKNLHVK